MPFLDMTFKLSVLYVGRYQRLYPENGGDIFLHNVVTHLPHYRTV